MFPYFALFGRRIPMYGTMTAIGLVLTLIYLKLRTRRTGKLEPDFQLGAICAGVGAMVGAKLLWLATVWPAFVGDLPYLFSETTLFLNMYLFSGFVFYGGLYGALFGAWLYQRLSHSMSFDTQMNLLLPCFPLLHAFGRIGCFCMGCCFGRETSSAIGVVFHASEVAPNGVPLVPTQLIEALFELLLFALCALLAAKKVSGRRILGLYLLLYGLERFLLEFFRGDMARGFIGVLSVSQVISVPTVLFGLFLCLRPARPLSRAAPGD